MSDEVKIEEAEGTLTGGYIPWLKEKYPFSKLTPAIFTDESKTTVKGPSFVIPKSANPPSVLAAGRKRFKHCTFISRKANKDGDIRVWLHPESPIPTDKPAVGGSPVEAEAKQEKQAPKPAPTAAKKKDAPKKAAPTASPAPAAAKSA